MLLGLRHTDQPGVRDSHDHDHGGAQLHKVKLKCWTFRR
jgi:hypothetical protein